ncbi:MAG: sigma-70 family RNA polymerase sigma factor, partial [Armatimonadota bacterium]
VRNLPERERRVLHLYYFEEHTLREIGQKLGVTESRVCQIHGRAIRRLRQQPELAALLQN